VWNGREFETRLAVRAALRFDPAQFLPLEWVSSPAKAGDPVSTAAGATGFPAFAGNDSREPPVTIITDPLFYALAIPARSPGTTAVAMTSS
jgi:hypothetical protein